LHDETANESDGAVRTKDYRGWLQSLTNPKVEISNLNYLISIRDSAKSGLGFTDNRHLNYFAESINMNVGGFYQDVKVSSPPMTDRSVGGAVVVRARESRVQGEGRQEVNIFLVEINSKSCECSGRSER
jgi:hypothetical protein